MILMRTDIESLVSMTRNKLLTKYNVFDGVEPLLEKTLNRTHELEEERFVPTSSRLLQSED